MKKTLAAIAAILISGASYGQGQLTFATKVGTDVDAPVWAPNATGTTGAGSQGTINAQLFLVAANGSLTALTPATTFRTTTFTQYINPADITVPGIDVGGTAKIRFRAFNGATFETSSIRGENLPANDINVVLGGGTQPPANLNGLTGFTMTNVPEPSTIALGVLGLGALLIRRRK